LNRRRFFALVVMLGLGALVVVGRSVQVAVLEHDEWKRLALRQQEQVIEVPGPRGTIRSADGYVLATSVSRVAIQIDTKLLNYPEIFIHAAAPLLGVSQEELDRRLDHGPRNVWLAKRVQRERAEQVRVLAPQAIVLVPDFARIYPQGSLAAPVIGFGAVPHGQRRYPAKGAIGAAAPRPGWIRPRADSRGEASGSVRIGPLGGDSSTRRPRGIGGSC